MVSIRRYCCHKCDEEFVYLPDDLAWEGPGWYAFVDGSGLVKVDPQEFISLRSSVE